MSDKSKNIGGGSVPPQTLESGTYEIIQGRLFKQKSDLQDRLKGLNAERLKVFGSLETRLIANDRINTENNCIARDIIALGDTCIFGYNVHFGLRTEITLGDVFSIYDFDRVGDDGEGLRFRESKTGLSLLDDQTFITDFTNLYRYYRNTIFSKFAVVGNYLHMVFQLSESATDIKTFKWLIDGDSLQYIDNRSEHEYKFPRQHEFNWQEAGRDQQRYGEHAHVSILDKVFVETIGGDLTIKIEDNTDDGQGIYEEPVEHLDQTLDDGQFRFADLGNLIVLEIKPFQEQPRYFVYNHKIKDVTKIPAIGEACVLLPDDQGIMFPNGYYLQTGENNLFPSASVALTYQQRIASPNGEDHLYVFYNKQAGAYTLMSYNVIEQEVKTPIVCNGFTLLEKGEMCYFKTEDEQTKHHMIQIWQTPYLKGTIMPSQHQDSLLYKIGNKDIVKAMAQSHELITLLDKEDSYIGLYDDIADASKEILDSFYWINDVETHELSIPLKEINKAANAAIDEFEKVKQLRKNAAQRSHSTQKKADELFSKIKSSSFKSIDDFVQLLTQLRTLRGEIIELGEVRYIDKKLLQSIEVQIIEQKEVISRRAVTFLLDDKALQPYHELVAEKEQKLEEAKKVVALRDLSEEVNQIAKNLELLIEIVSNLEIEDTSHSTQIIERISVIFTSLNQLRAAIKNKSQNAGKKEAQADFAAQLKLIDQSIINYLDLATTPEKCEEYLTRISIQLEELEGKFANYDEFLETITEKREEVYAAFETRRNQLIESRNKRTAALQNSGERIIKGIEKRAQSFETTTEINGYFAADLMVNKVRDIVKQLQELDDAGKAESLETKLKVAWEDAQRRLKDRQELYEDGNAVIKLGKHKFGVNNQELDLTIVFRDEELYAHLIGTDYYQEIDHPVLTQSQEYWNQELISENKKVYRSEYLAYQIFKQHKNLHEKSHAELHELVKEKSTGDYTGGYIKGVHDVDATQILEVLAQKHHDLGLLRFDASTRAWAQHFWQQLGPSISDRLLKSIKNASDVLTIFPESQEYLKVINAIEKAITAVSGENLITSTIDSNQAATYLFYEHLETDGYVISASASQLMQDFEKYLQSRNADLKFKDAVESCDSAHEKGTLVEQWYSAFAKKNSQTADTDSKALQEKYIHEAIAHTIYSEQATSKQNNISSTQSISNLKGSHVNIDEGTLEFDYQDFVERLKLFDEQNVPQFLAFKKAKHEITEELKENLRLEEFKPRVLSSFVRNKLIDQVYFPLIGDNLAKQLGTIGDKKRTDRMGLLLLISPPGYGKTTLMEYVANRLGLIFMKINGPSIGHQVTSVDPETANNSAARAELKKLNLALEMGDNVMLYLDDIQHCHPEFLQKFISLSDGTRRMEGVYNGKPKTYDLRGKKFCVIMAGNPYTESGEKFQIPDMLANRADIYNLGDIIGDTAHLFELSLIENSVTSNPVLQDIANAHFEDLYTFIDRVESGNPDGELKGNYTNQEIQDITAVLTKVMHVRDTVLKVNESYITSAAMDDDYRTEPAFKLQGSYRDMNKLVAKIAAIMDDKELQTLLLTHYENESQTLTTAAEANMLKFKELTDTLSDLERVRWASIKETFAKNNKVKALGGDHMASVISQLMTFGKNLEGIQRAIESTGNNSKNID
jgi:hypothetical protein